MLTRYKNKYLLKTINKVKKKKKKYPFKKLPKNF